MLPPLNALCVGQAIIDWRLQTARWVLNRMPGEELLQIAAGAMVQGDDPPSLRLLAAESRPTIGGEAGPLFLAVLRELKLALPDPRAAIMILARELAGKILDGQLGVHNGARELASLFLQRRPATAMLHAVKVE